MLRALSPSTHSTSRALNPECCSGTTTGSIGSMFSMFIDAPAFLVGRSHTRGFLKNRAAISLGFEHSRYRRLTLSSVSSPRHDPLTDDQRLAAHFRDQLRGSIAVLLFDNLIVDILGMALV